MCLVGKRQQNQAKVEKLVTSTASLGESNVCVVLVGSKCHFFFSEKCEGSKEASATFTAITGLKLVFLGAPFLELQKVFELASLERAYMRTAALTKKNVLPPHGSTLQAVCTIFEVGFASACLEKDTAFIFMWQLLGTKSFWSCDRFLQQREFGQFALLQVLREAVLPSAWWVL